jgi:antitoxin (DNA-binding transcriptional repressor) of toxin-antitoxin stability system
MTRVNIQEAKTHLSRYIDRVEQGDVIIVCRHNQPVAELRAVEVSLVRPVRVAGLLKGQVHWEPNAFAPMTTEELAEFEGAPVFPKTGRA